MPRLKMTMTVVTEYDADPVDYQDGVNENPTPDQMAVIDQANYYDDPHQALDGYDSLDIKVEVVG